MSPRDAILRCLLDALPEQQAPVPAPSYADMSCATVEVAPVGGAAPPLAAHLRTDSDDRLDLALRLSQLDPRLASRLSAVSDEILAGAISRGDGAAPPTVDPHAAVLDWLVGQGLMSDQERRGHQAVGQSVHDLAPLLLHLSFSSRDRWVAMLKGEPSMASTPSPAAALDTIAEAGAAAGRAWVPLGVQTAATGELKPIDQNRYQVQQELGRGGMGVVYKAWDNDLKRTVAIKSMIGDRAPGSLGLSRFHREALACARLRHPHIVQLHDVGTWRGAPCLVMDYIEGPTLSAWVRSLSDFNRTILDRGLGIVLQVVEAVAYAHRQGVVHRDIKPENVLIDLEGNAYLTDYGLAREIGSQEHVTQTGAVVGTPVYMSPEQAGGATDASHTLTDVYSLGAVLYNVATGKPPFQGENIAAVIYQVIHTEPIAPCKTFPWIPPDVATIIQKCMDKEPARRYATAEDLAEDLRRYLKGEPIHAVPLGMTTRVFRRARKHPLVTASLLGGTLALATAIAWAVEAGVAAEHARREQERAIAEQDRIEGRRGKSRERVGRAQLTRPEEALPLYGEALELDPANVEALLGRAGALRGLGRSDPALTDCDAALRLAPDSVPALLLRGAILRDDLGRIDDAVRDFRRVSELDPTTDAGLIALALVRAQAGAADEALALLEQAAERNPRNAETWLARARIRRQGKDLARALQEASQAVALRPDAAEAYEVRAQVRLALRDRARALEDANRMVDLAPQNPAGWRLRASIRSESGDVDAALADLERAVALRPDDVDLRATRLKLHLGRRDIHAALADLDEIVKRKPGDRTARIDRAKLLVRAGRYKDSLEAWNEVIPEGGGEGDWHVWRGVVWLLLRNSANCLRDMNVAAVNKPIHELSLYLEIAQSVREQGRDEVAGTILGMVKVIFRDDHAASIELGKLFAEKGEWAKAAEEYGRALSIRERLGAAPARKAEALALRAEALLRSGQAAAALADAERSLALASGDRHARVIRAFAWVKTGRATDALRELDAALLADPEDAFALAIRAEGFRLLGDLRPAARAVAEALARDPGLVPAYLCRAELRAAAGDPSGARADLACAARIEPALAEGLRPRIDELARAAGDPDDAGFAAAEAEAQGKPPEAALASWSRRLAARPDDARARLRRAEAWRAAGLPLLARDDFLEAIDRAAPNIEARMGLADLERTALHDPDAALREYDHVLRLRWNRPELYLARARALLDLRAPSRAIAELGALLILDRKCGPAYALRGALYRESGLHSLAVQDLNRALALAERAPDPALDPVALRLERARARSALGEHDAVRKDLDEVLAARPGDGEALVLRAETLLALGDREAAAADARRASAASSSDVQRRAALVLGRALLDQGDLGAAVESLLIAASRGADLLALLGEMEAKALAAADPAPWLRVLDAVLGTRPDAPVVRAARLRALLRASRIADALPECAQLVGPDPAAPVEPWGRLRGILSQPGVDAAAIAGACLEAARGGEDPNAAAWFDLAVAASGLGAETLEARAAWLRGRKRWAEAARDHEQLLARYPEDVETHLEYVRLLAQEIRDARRTREAADRIAARCGGDAKSLLALGKACSTVGAHDRAIELYTQGVKADPQNADNHHERGHAHQKRRDWAAALADFARVAEMQKDGLDHVYREMAECHRHLKNPEQEEKCLSLAVDSAPGNVETLRDRAVFFFQQKKWDECRADLRRIQGIARDADAHAWYLGGTIDLNLGRIPEAADELRKALQHREHFPEAHHNLAVVLARQGNLEEAVGSASQAIRTSPAWGEAYVLRGELLLRQNKHSDALSDLRKAIQLKPELAARVDPLIREAEKK